MSNFDHLTLKIILFQRNNPHSIHHHPYDQGNNIFDKLYIGLFQAFRRNHILHTFLTSHFYSDNFKGAMDRV